MKTASSLSVNAVLGCGFCKSYDSACDGPEDHQKDQTGYPDGNLPQDTKHVEAFCEQAEAREKHESNEKIPDKAGLDSNQDEGSQQSSEYLADQPGRCKYGNDCAVEQIGPDSDTVSHSKEDPAVRSGHLQRNGHDQVLSRDDGPAGTQTKKSGEYADADDGPQDGTGPGQGIVHHFAQRILVVRLG